MYELWIQGLGVLARGENIFRRFSSSAASMPTLKSTCHQVQIKSEESSRKHVRVAKKGQSTTVFPHSPPRKTLPQYIKFAQVVNGLSGQQRSVNSSESSRVSVRGRVVRRTAAVAGSQRSAGFARAR